MLKKIKRFARKLLRPEPGRVAISWVRKGTGAWLATTLFPDNSLRPPTCDASVQIERLANQTNDLGPQQLWSGYQDKARGSTRLPDGVRTSRLVGNLFCHIVKLRKPQTVVEFGTAFGISGMYWLAGLEENAAGVLYTFEPNREWATIAEENLKRIGSRFKLTLGTFEENVDTSIPRGHLIDLAFIDAIHTTEFVLKQLELVMERSAPGAIIVLDDIDFSEDMRHCWRVVSTDPRFVASTAVGARIGIVELARTA